MKFLFCYTLSTTLNAYLFLVCDCSGFESLAYAHPLSLIEHSICVWVGMNLIYVITQKDCVLRVTCSGIWIPVALILWWDYTCLWQCHLVIFTVPPFSFPSLSPPLPSSPPLAVRIICVFILVISYLWIRSFLLWFPQVKGWSGVDLFNSPAFLWNLFHIFSKVKQCDGVHFSALTAVQAVLRVTPLIWDQFWNVLRLLLNTYLR